MSTVKKAETEPKAEAPKAEPAQLGSHLPIADVLKSTFSDKTNLMALLAAAGASGLLGGYVTSKSLKRPGETPGQRRARILANALGTGAAGAGAVGAGLLGANIYNSRRKEEPGLYDKTIGKMPALMQVGGIGGGVAGSYFGGAKGFKSLEADKANTLARLQNAGARKGMPPISAADIQEAFGERADPKIRNEVRSELRRRLNPAAQSMKGLGAQNIKIEEELARAGLSAKLSPSARSKLLLGKTMTVAGRSGIGAVKGSIGGAALGLGTQWLTDYFANKFGQ